MKFDLRRLLQNCADGTAVIRKPVAPALIGTLAWNRHGIRDPSLLMDADGVALADDLGRFTLFFNARDRASDAGGITCVGMARGNEQDGWAVEPEPVYRDGSYAAQGSVLRVAPDHYRLYYSPNTLHGFALASSTDGRAWRKFTVGLLLTPEQFGIRRMGLPFVRYVQDRWVMVFEGIKDGRFHIYVALSTDGLSWEPGNRGEAIYLPAAESWDCYGQANPSLYVADQGTETAHFGILYNGCAALHAWDIGLVVAGSLGGPWRGTSQPLLRRGGAGEWDGARIEGARLIETARDDAAIVYFGLPTKGSYAGGAIAMAHLEYRKDAEGADPMASAANAAAERAHNDALAARYFDIWDRWPIQRFSNEVESRWLASVIAASSRVIVLGSGGGREFPPMLAKGCRLTAIDISPQMIAAGRARFPEFEIDWVEADLHQLPRHLGGFDAAVCLGAVFNYLRDPALFLANVRRVLKSGGHLLMACINSRHPSEPQAQPALPSGRVRRPYSLAEVETLLHAAGFEIAQSRGIRFLVDLLPADWNRKAGAACDETAILENALAVERGLLDRLPADQGKYILVHAIAGDVVGGTGSAASLTSPMRNGRRP